MRVILCAIALAVMAGPLWAADVSAVWVKQLRIDGYEDIEVGRTWLGRIRILAEKGEIEREIILHRSTGVRIPG